MKRFFLFSIAVFFSFHLFSQDTLFTKKGEMIGAKVIEINQDEIKYKKSANPDGPLYVISKSEVVLIEYQNGTRDVFESAAQPPDVKSENSDDQTGTVYAAQQRPRLNVVVGALPLLGCAPWGWGWGWNSGWAWGWNRGYWRGGGHHGHFGGHHHGNYGHYGRRGGHR